MDFLKKLYTAVKQEASLSSIPGFSGTFPQLLAVVGKHRIHSIIETHQSKKIHEVFLLSMGPWAAAKKTFS